MPKTIKSLIYEAEAKQQMWLEFSEDETALKDRNKTREEALRLADYFEGKVDGLTEALRYSSSQLDNDQIKVLVCDDDSHIKDLVVSACQSIENVMVLGGIAEKSVYEIKAFPREVGAIQIKEHGAYRQFEKRDKRKNFR